MKFAIAVFLRPTRPPRAALCNLPRQHWPVGMILSGCFYQDGVHSASANVVAPQDELDVAANWRSFISEHQLDAVVCIAAALRRGVLNAEEAQRYQRPAVNLPAPWELSGLGQLHEGAQSADRLICFGGD